MNPSDHDRHEDLHPLAHGRPEPDTLHGVDVGAREPDDFTVVSVASRRRIGTGLALFTLLGIGAAASLWSMRAIGRASADTTPQTEAGRLVESYLKERTDLKAAAGEALAAAPLPVGSAAELQIPRERLARDPFASPWRRATVDAAGAQDGAVVADAGARPASDRDARIAEWQTLVDEGAHDFVVESVLTAADPALSIVSMNGGVFRVGEHVMFPDRPVRYEIVSVAQDAVTLRARNDEFELERTVKLLLRPPQ